MSSITPRPALRPALLIVAVAATLATCLGIAVAGASAVSSINIYSNSMKSAGAAAKIRQYGGKANCSRKGSTNSLRVKVGKKTHECYFNVPVVGRDLQASITARLFRATPKPVIRKVWMAVNLRQARDGSRYQLAVMPRTGRYMLRKIHSSGKAEKLAQGKNRKAINGVGPANRITLRAYNGVGKLPVATARLTGIVNGKRLFTVDDPHGRSLAGRDTTISIGANSNVNGAGGSFVGARVAVPDPF